jgi:large subunit ribosomal protein L3
MVKALVGKKMGMTQVFDDKGDLVPVTVLEVGPCLVVQVMRDTEGKCRTVQIGFDERKRKRTPKPLLGQFEKAGVSPKRVLREVEAEEGAQFELGQSLGAGVFSGTAMVNVTAETKGRGFQGVIKRWGYKGGRMTHGAKMRRHAGSTGPGSTPGHTMRGRKMAGHMGCETRTIRNLKVVRIDEANNLLLLKGAVPGSKGSYVLVKKATGRKARKAAEKK